MKKTPFMFTACAIGLVVLTPQFTHSSQAKPFWKCSQLFQLTETAKQMAFTQYTKNDGLIFLRSRPHYKSLSDQIPDKPRTMLAKKNIYGQPDPHVSGSLSLSLSPQNRVDSNEVIQNEAK